MRPSYLGLTGPNSSGKGEIADHLSAKHGYRRHSLSDVLRDEAKRRGVEPVRGILIGLGNELRATRGAGVLAELVLPELTPPALVDSIRNPEEVEVLRGLPGFVLVAVEAPMDLRFLRSVARRRPGDPASLEEFRRREDQENGADPMAQQLKATAALADHVLRNHGSLDDLHRAVDDLLGRLA